MATRTVVPQLAQTAGLRKGEQGQTQARIDDTDLDEVAAAVGSVVVGTAVAGVGTVVG